MFEEVCENLIKSLNEHSSDIFIENYYQKLVYNKSDKHTKDDTDDLSDDFIDNLTVIDDNDFIER